MTLQISHKEEVRKLESILMGLEQVQVETVHTFHAGMYCRTVYTPKGLVLVGVEIKVPTIVFFDGVGSVFTAGEWVKISGSMLFRGESGRKQVFISEEDCTISMVFPTKATTIEEAEKEFTDEYDMLMTNRLGEK